MSPRFLQLIVDHCKNDQKTSYLKTVLSNEFDDDVIKIYLKYLGMNIVYDEMYKPVPDYYSSIGPRSNTGSTGNRGYIGTSGCAGSSGCTGPLGYTGQPGGIGPPGETG
jgi:hypothetical protein